MCAHTQNTEGSLCRQNICINWPTYQILNTYLGSRNGQNGTTFQFKDKWRVTTYIVLKTHLLWWHCFNKRIVGESGRTKLVECKRIRRSPLRTGRRKLSWGRDLRSRDRAHIGVTNRCRSAAAPASAPSWRLPWFSWETHSAAFIYRNPKKNAGSSTKMRK